MNNAVAVFLAVVLVCSLPVMAVVAADSNAETPGETDGSSTVDAQQSAAFLEVENTTNRLIVDGDGEHAYITPESDISSVVAGADDELRIDYDRHTFERQFADSASEDREQLIERRLELVADRTHDLNAREQSLVRAHANGETSDRDLVRTLLRNYNEANELSQFVHELEEYAAQVPGYSIRDEAREMRNKLDTHQSPIRTQIDAASADSQSPLVTVESSENGYSLSLISDQNYVREVTRFDHRDPNGTAQIASVSAANDHAELLYPWAFDNARGTSVHELDRHLYRLEVPHNQGDLDAFFDGATEQVTREHQTLAIGELPIEPVDETWRDGDLELSVNVTPANGPAEVLVTDATTGEPVDATISIGGHEIGETGEDGTLWIAPPTGTYEITAESGLESVNGTISD